MKDQDKSVCLIGGGLSIGGQERALVFLANALAEKGVKVFVIALFNTPIEFELHPSIMVYFPKIDRSKTSKFIYAFKIIPFIRATIKKEQPKSVICFGDWFNAFSILATRGLAVKMVITNRMGPNLFLGNFVETMNRVFYRFADEMIVQTERAKKILGNKYKIRKITVIPNPIEVRSIEKIISKKQIITIGRLSKEKGQAVLIKAFSKIKDKEWTLHLVGDGPEKSTLESLTKELQIQDRVIFHGKMYNFEHLLMGSQIFVLPSYYEGFPNALLEAMSFGLCCIASDCIAGPSEIIENEKNGLLFETGNHEYLSFLLNRIIEDASLREKLASNTIQSLGRFEKDSIIKQFEKTLL